MPVGIPPVEIDASLAKLAKGEWFSDQDGNRVLECQQPVPVAAALPVFLGLRYRPTEVAERARLDAEFDRFYEREEFDPVLRLSWETMRLWLGTKVTVPADDQLRDALRALRTYKLPPVPDDEDENDDTVPAEIPLVERLAYLADLGAHPRAPRVSARLAQIIRAAGAAESGAPTMDQRPQGVTMPPRTSSLSPELPKLPLENFHDVGNAQRLLVYCGTDIRWCAAMKKWLVWNGRRWALDDMEGVRKRAMYCMAEYLKQALDAGNMPAQKFARASLDYKRLRDMLEVTKALVPIQTSKLDTDPIALNFENGTLDLETGQLRPHRREDYITKMVHHDYRPDAQCPRFLGFLSRIMGAQPDASEAELECSDRMVAWLQKGFGYSLTGITSEKVVFICHGASGDNGKTTLLSTFRKLIEEYATLIQIDTLMTRQAGNNEQADLADLRGSRFAMSTEVGEGQTLSEARLKRLTQGMGTIKATRKFENPVQFPETHKLWIDGNHRPNVRGSDGAIWNRLLPIPFTVKIPAAEIDRKFSEKLLAEAEGILAWVVAGALRWRREGLGRPDEIRQARNQWRKDTEPLKDFFDDCCRRDPDAFTQVSALWEAYVAWCSRQKVRDQLTREQFTTRLEDLGFERITHRFGKNPERAWRGIELR